MSLILDGSNGITFPNSSTQAVGFYGFKNRIINGAMVIDQRNAGASVSMTTSTYSVDRYRVYASQTSKMTAQQTPSATETGYATRVAAGFTNYLAFTSSSSFSAAAGDRFMVYQGIEGYNVADLAYGSSGAKTTTLSFWAYSSLTGTHSGAINNSLSSRCFAFTFTINSANTWEYKTVVIAGDTASAMGSLTNSTGLEVTFNLGCGSTYLTSTANAWQTGYYLGVTGSQSVVGTNGATFYITGVQLEAGSTATSFDYRPYGTELALCQRYYEIGYSVVTSYGNGTNGINMSMPMKVTKRSTPTGTVTIDVAAGSINYGTISFSAYDLNSVYLGQSAASSAGYSRIFYSYTISSEL